VVGVSPRTFITRTRIDAARRLLLTSSYSIGRIADLLGYDSPFQFSRQFKARVGIAPKHFRNQGRSIGT
jgi:AraC-like DNA-binding protein